MHSSHLKKWRTNPELLAGLLMAAVICLLAALAPQFAPLPASRALDDLDRPQPDYIRVVGQLSHREHPAPEPPSKEALLGTTTGQVDVFHALIWGVRSALRFGLIVASGAAVLGSLIGLVSGSLGGWPNWLLMRITDGFLTFPLIAGLVINRALYQVFYEAAIASAENPNWARFTAEPLLPPLLQVLLSFEFLLILFTWMPYARLVNAMVLRLHSVEFVEAARALGAGRWRIMIRHLLPNCLSPVLVLFSRDIGGVVLIQSALTFIGMGGESVWGELLGMGKDWIYGLGGNPLKFWWVFVPASVAIIIFGIAFSLLGDGLNDLLNRHHPA